MGSNPRAARAGRFHGRRDCGIAQFLLTRLGAFGEHRPGCDQLDRIRAAVEHQVDLASHLGRSGGNPHAHFRGNLHASGKPGYLSAPAWDGNIAADGVDPRAGYIATVNRVAQLDIAHAAI